MKEKLVLVLFAQRQKNIETQSTKIVLRIFVFF